MYREREGGKDRDAAFRSYVGLAAAEMMMMVVTIAPLLLRLNEYGLVFPSFGPALFRACETDDNSSSSSSKSTQRLTMVSATARLSEGKIAEFKDAFDLFTEATGTELLKNEDLPELMRGLGELLTETDAKALQGKAGPMIDFPSFLNIMAARMDEREREGSVQTLPEKLDNAFKVLDPQERGFIEEKELKHLLMTLGDKLSEEDVADMLKDAERTEDNHIKLPIRSLYS